MGNDVEESEIQNTPEREDTRGAQHASKEAKELDARGNQGKYGSTSVQQRKRERICDTQTNQVRRRERETGRRWTSKDERREQIQAEGEMTDRKRKKERERERKQKE